MATPQAPAGGTITPTLMQTSANKSIQSIIPPQLGNLVRPLRGGTVAILAIVSSLFFIMSISMAFLGAYADEPFFMHTLDVVAESSPGVVLIGETVDVDIEEPSITIRWSIMACGEEFVLPGSTGAHGSNLCGLPASAMRFYVDSDDTPTATYDPSQIPFNKGTGQRRRRVYSSDVIAPFLMDGSSIQNLVQFDSDHVLDVHETRLYPFDTYMLSSTIRAVSFHNQTIPIRKAATIDVTSSFDIFTIDVESYLTTQNGSQETSRDIDMHVSCPNDARFFTLLLFGVSWILTHVTVGHVLIAWRLTGRKSLLPHLISSGAILIAIPQLRNSMPDAPGLVGVLIDCIGFFPQMVIVGLSTVTLLLILAVREFNSMKNLQPALPVRKWPSSIRSHFPRPPQSPTANSTSMEIAQWEMRRLVKHLRGEYVFPPVKHFHRVRPSDASKPSHRRVQAMSKTMEAGEVSYWSESGEE